MKKLIGVVVASMIFANIGYAEMRLIENMDRTDKKNEFVPNFMTVCIDNHKFAVSQFHEGISMVQFYETVDHYNRVIGTALPAKC